MPAGRPTDYDPAYCEQVIEYGRAGKSRAWMCAELGICRQTLANWEKAHPEFLDATTRAGLHSQAWWEDAGQTGITSDKFNSSAWAKSMAARFPEEWRDKQEIAHNAVGDLAALIAERRAQVAKIDGN